MKAIENLNTLALLTYPIYYLAGLLNVFNGRKLEIRDRYSFALPEIKPESDWTALVSEFLKNVALFASQVEHMDETMLNQPFVEEKHGSQGEILKLP